MKGEVNRTMILLAREARGINQYELAERINMSPTNLSKIERGEIGLSEELLEAISDKTGYPVHFFYQEGTIVPENLMFRKRQNVAQKLLTPINARINILRRHVQFLTRALNLPLPDLPSWPVTEKRSPQKIAAMLRSQWNIHTPVIGNLTRLLESKGLAIIHFDFGTERVDSRSILTDDKYPVIFLNKTLLGDRQRFSLAYELGHLIMHTFTNVPHSRDISSEANAFAAEFLMPEKEVRADFDQGLSISLLGACKRKWKVSMIALLYRADDLGYLTPNQKRYLLQQFNMQKIRRREPVELDVDAEEPTVVKKWVAICRSHLGLSLQQIAAVLCLNSDEFIELYA